MYHDWLGDFFCGPVVDCLCGMSLARKKEKKKKQLLTTLLGNDAAHTLTGNFVFHTMINPQKPLLFTVWVSYICTSRRKNPHAAAKGTTTTIWAQGVFLLPMCKTAPRPKRDHQEEEDNMQCVVSTTTSSKERREKRGSAVKNLCSVEAPVGPVSPG